MRNYFTFSGQDSREFDVYISGHKTFDSPERAYDFYEVPGRNGSIAKDRKSLKNKELVYNAFIFTDFDKNFSNLKNFLLSRSGYCRLQDTYHPDEYRLAIFKNAIEPDMDQRNEVGMFELVFECQPQRYLLTGEEIDEMDVSDPPGETYTGDVVAFDNPGDNVIFDLKAEIDASFGGHNQIATTLENENHESVASIVQPFVDGQGNSITVHKGKVDIDSGILTDEANYISSYDPLSIPSDFDEIIQTNTEVETASGSIASFNCQLGEYPLESLTAQINPVQDLHGYDHPWPGGGGKNLADESAVSPYSASATVVYNQQDETISVSGSVTYAAGQINVQLQAGVTYAFSVHVIQATAQTRFGLRRATGGQIIASDTNYATSDSDLSFTFTPTEDMTGRITLFSAWNQANDETAIFSKVQCEVGSAPTSYAPYENLCPITGWTGVEAEQTGKNLLKLPPLDRPSRYGVEYEIVGGVLSFSGTSTSASAPWANSQHYSYELADNGPYPAGNYQISVDGFPTGVTSYTYLQLGIFHKDGTSGGSVYLIRGNDTGSAITQISLLDGDKLALFLQIARETTVDNTVHVLMTRAGESSDFEPFIGNTYSANWQDTAGTVYDGEIELVSGGLTDKARIYAFDGTENITYSSANGRFYWTLPNAITNSASGVDSTGYCSHYAVLTNVTATDLNTADMALTYSNSAISSTQGCLAIKDSRFTDADSYKSWLAEQYAAGKPLQIVYLRGTNATYQLTPTQIATLLGQNNIWADTGDVSVEYRDGDVQDFEDVTLSDDALLTGTKIIYPKDTPDTYSLTPATLQLIDGTNYIYANTGDVTVRVAEPFSITNPTYFDSRPLIRVYGTGTLHIGEYTIIISEANEYTDIDCSIMDCFKGSENRNPYVSFSNHEFPVLKPGYNRITMGTGITKIEITPRWFRV